MEIFALIFTKALPLFMTLDPMGNAGIVAAIVRHFDPERQRKILRREVLIALFAMVFFYVVGAAFLNMLGISQAAVEITGGLIFLLFAISLLFPGHGVKLTGGDSEPFIVPIAIPLIAGPSCLATIMLYAHESTPYTVAFPAIGLAWLCTAIIVTQAPRLAAKLGPNGIRIVEQVVGLICAFFAIQTFLRGVHTFLGN